MQFSEASLGTHQDLPSNRYQTNSQQAFDPIFVILLFLLHQGWNKSNFSAQGLKPAKWGENREAREVEIKSKLMSRLQSCYARNITFFKYQFSNIKVKHSK